MQAKWVIICTRIYDQVKYKVSKISRSLDKAEKEKKTQVRKHIA